MSKKSELYWRACYPIYIKRWIAYLERLLNELHIAETDEDRAQVEHGIHMFARSALVISFLDEDDFESIKRTVKLIKQGKPLDICLRELHHAFPPKEYKNCLESWEE